MSAQPRRFEIERDRHGRMCSPDLQVGECVRVREDRAVAADIEAMACSRYEADRLSIADLAQPSWKALCQDPEQATCVEAWRTSAQRDLAAIFSDVEDDCAA